MYCVVCSLTVNFAFTESSQYKMTMNNNNNYNNNNKTNNSDNNNDNDINNNDINDNNKK